MEVAGRTEQRNDAMTSNETMQMQLLTADMKHGGACTSSAMDGGLTKNGGTDVQHSPAPNDTTLRTQSTTAKMGPPVAPASFFWTLETSHRALAVPVQDLYIVCRLVVVVVILFRAGNIRYAKVIGQYAVDLMRKKKWQERLPSYLSAQPEPNDDDAVYALLEEARRALKKVNAQNAAYLEVVMATMK